MPEVTIEWLKEQAKQLVKKHWSIQDIPSILLVTRTDSITVEQNLDWDNHGGYYCSSIRTIIMNNENNRNYSLREVKRILLHELVHWRLHTTGEPWSDSDERFALELIRVGLGRRHNPDEKSLLAVKKARARKRNEFFEIYERNEETILVFRLSHHRKNQDDFKHDLANTLIRMHNKREDESEIIYPSDVADMMCKWYGYKSAPLAVYGIELTAHGSYGLGGDIGDTDDVRYLLGKLDVDDEIINKRLKKCSIK